MRWGARKAICNNIADLNRLVSEHPCWLNGAVVETVPSNDPLVTIFSRRADGHHVLVCINNDEEQHRNVSATLFDTCHDLLTGQIIKDPHSLPPLTVRCYSGQPWKLDAGKAGTERAGLLQRHHVERRVMPTRVISCLHNQCDLTGIDLDLVTDSFVRNPLKPSAPWCGGIKENLSDTVKPWAVVKRFVPQRPDTANAHPSTRSLSVMISLSGSHSPRR